MTMEGTPLSTSVNRIAQPGDCSRIGEVDASQEPDGQPHQAGSPTRIGFRPARSHPPPVSPTAWKLVKKSRSRLKPPARHIVEHSRAGARGESGKNGAGPQEAVAALAGTGQTWSCGLEAHSSPPRAPRPTLHNSSGRRRY